jgi:hypothetical protein
MSRSLNTLSAQALHFLAPLLGMFSGPKSEQPPPAPEMNHPVDPQVDPPSPSAAAHELLSQFLERPDSITHLCDRIEAIEKERASST